jgi:hypothetical protein
LETIKISRHPPGAGGKVPKTLLAIAAFAGLAVFRLGRFALGALGLWVVLGPPWAVLGVAALLVCRISAPIRIGAFLGATSLLGWPWVIALVLAAPRLWLVLPGLIATLLGRLRHPRPLWHVDVETGAG